MKTSLLALFLFLPTLIATANTPPTPVVLSAAMRPGTTLMDVVYRVNDPDDTTVKVRALAFVDGVRSFANVIRPVTFVEGTEANLGDDIAANRDFTLTWDVAADWDIDLGQIIFEILCRDGRGLLEFDWITIPAVGDEPELTISKNSPSDASVLDALFWQYADGDSALTLKDGVLSRNGNWGNFASISLAEDKTLQSYSLPYLMKRMNLDPASSTAVNYAVKTARAGLVDTTRWHAANRPYSVIPLIIAWGPNEVGQTSVPAGLTDFTIVVAGHKHNLALKSNNTVVAWGANEFDQTTVPIGLSNVTAIAGGGSHSLALKNDGTVVAWGHNDRGQSSIPAGLTNVTAIAGGAFHSLALKSDGRVSAWGSDYQRQTIIPAGLAGVTAIAGGGFHSLALKSDGRVSAWGSDYQRQTIIPAGLAGVTAIAGGGFHSLALKNDGTVVAWGDNYYGQSSIPAGLTNVTAIAAGHYHSLALRSNGTVIAWGLSTRGQTNVPYGLTNVIAITAGDRRCLAIKSAAP